MDLVKFIETIEKLSKSKSLRSGDVDSFLKELLLSTTSALNCSRANVWKFNENRDALECLSSYSIDTDSFESGYSLKKKEYPNYFKFLMKNELIVSNKALDEKINIELIDTYLLPNKIRSMIDVPLRSEGAMIGVICFEQVINEREWKPEEQKFTQSIAQLVSLALETKKKRQYREELESIVKQKDLLLSEVNHRVKNNISIILSLINLQKHKVKDEFHELLFDEIRNKVFSISAVQEQLHLSEHLDKINTEQYLRELVSNLNNSFARDRALTISWDLKPLLIDITQAIPLGLIANELITNSFKYAFIPDNLTPFLHISCTEENGEIIFKVKDNGSGISSSSKGGMGMEIVESLCTQIDAKLYRKFDNGLETTIVF